MTVLDGATEAGDRSTAVARQSHSTGSVVSPDGTVIGYRQVGRGLGVVVLHGTMESAQSHMELAEALADAFTVYLPDRRGRGLSGPYGKTNGIQTEVDDLDALLTATGAHYVFGVSSGAIVLLQAALALPAIQKAAIFEPPLNINGSLSTAPMKRYDDEIAEGETASALVTAMKAAQMGPAALRAMPRWLLESLTKMMMASEDRNATADDVTMRMLAPTIHYDFQLIIETERALDTFRAIPADVLLLGGSKSPAYLKVALDALQKIVPTARRVEFEGLDHGASGPTNRGGKPDRVAGQLRRFFA